MQRGRGQAVLWQQRAACRGPQCCGKGQQAVGTPALRQRVAARTQASSAVAGVNECYAHLAVCAL